MNPISIRVEWLNPQQAYTHLTKFVWPQAKSLLMAGNQLAGEIVLRQESKTEAQRKYYHGVILTTIAEQARPNGVQYAMPVWKEYFRDKYLGKKRKTVTDPMTGKKIRRLVRVSTEDLGIRAYNELIERVTAFAATELGVQFPAEGHE